ALIIAAECETLPDGDWGKLIASAGDSNKETPAMPSVDCKNSRRPSVFLVFDGLIIGVPLSDHWFIGRACCIPERSLCQSISTPGFRILFGSNSRFAARKASANR